MFSAKTKRHEEVLFEISSENMISETMISLSKSEIGKLLISFF